MGETIHLHLRNRGNGYRLLNMEGQETFCRNKDLSTTGRGRGAKTDCCTDASADRRTLTASGSSSDETADTGTDCGLINGFHGFVAAVACPYIRRDGVDFATQSNGRELKRKLATTLQGSRGYGVDNGSFDGCAAGNRHSPVGNDVIYHYPIEPLAGLNAPAIKRLVDAHADEGTVRDGDHNACLLPTIGSLLRAIIRLLAFSVVWLLWRTVWLLGLTIWLLRLTVWLLRLTVWLLWLAV